MTQIIPKKEKLSSQKRPPRRNCSASPLCRLTAITEQKKMADFLKRIMSAATHSTIGASLSTTQSSTRHMTDATIDKLTPKKLSPEPTVPVKANTKNQALLMAPTRATYPPGWNTPKIHRAVQLPETLTTAFTTHGVTMAATERMRELLPASLAGRFDVAPNEFKPRVMFPAKDETFQHVLQLQGNTNKNTTRLCFRCKISECPGVAQCIFDSNVFLAQRCVHPHKPSLTLQAVPTVRMLSLHCKQMPLSTPMRVFTGMFVQNYSCRSMPCQVCQVPTKIGIDLVSKMKRGAFSGYVVHQACAKFWYDSNPKDSVLVPTLKFTKPNDELATFLSRYVRGETQSIHIDATAGSGKSNAILYVCHLLRERGVPFIVLVFNRAARKELQERGLLEHEVKTFHSFLYQQYKKWVTAKLEEDTIMRLAAPASILSKVAPNVCYIKIRLVVSFFFREHRFSEHLCNSFALSLANWLTKHVPMRSAAQTNHPSSTAGP